MGNRPSEHTENHTRRRCVPEHEDCIGTSRLGWRISSGGSVLFPRVLLAVLAAVVIGCSIPEVAEQASDASLQPATTREGAPSIPSSTVPAETTTIPSPTTTTIPATTTIQLRMQSHREGPLALSVAIGVPSGADDGTLRDAFAVALRSAIDGDGEVIPSAV